MSLKSNIDIHEIYDYVQTLSDIYRSLLVINDAVASGKLKDFTTRVDLSDNEIKVIYNLPQYWAWVEEGRPPSTAHRPPALQPSILQWIRDKNIHASAGQDGKVPTDEQLSWAITKSIHKKGYSGRPMLMKSLQDGKPIIDRIVGNAAEAMGKKEIDEDLIHIFDGIKDIKL